MWPRRVQTIGAMRDAGVSVKAGCTRCRNFFVVDLDILCTLYGRGYSLIGKRGRCRMEGCGGSCLFLYQPGEGLPFRKLS